jgi:hypothetical protein
MFVRVYTVGTPLELSSSMENYIQDPFVDISDYDVIEVIIE